MSCFLFFKYKKKATISYPYLKIVKIIGSLKNLYKNFLKKRNSDKEFKEKYYGEELKMREKDRKAKLKNDQSKIEELKNLQIRKTVKARFGKWEKINPWQQRLILTEKCIKYFKKENN